MTVTLSSISILKGYCHCPDIYDELILLMLKVNIGLRHSNLLSLYSSY